MGYQWWILDGSDGAFQGAGIFGQIVYVNPAKRVIVVQNAAWPQADPDERWDEAGQAMNAIVARVLP